MKHFLDFRSRLSQVRSIAARLTVATFALALWVADPLGAATFGKVVPIGGHASDLVLDEARGLLYIANFTANRIEVMTLSDQRVDRSYNVPGQPGSVTLSPDGRFLLVTHYGNFDTPSSPTNALTVLNLSNNTRQTFAFGFPPLAAAFGIDGQAIVATTNEILLFDPVSGTAKTLETIAQIAARTIPVIIDGKSFPPNIVASNMVASADGRKVYGILGAGPDVQDFVLISYDVATRRIGVSQRTSSPAMGPRVISSAQDGSYFMAGWVLRSSNFENLAQFPGISGDFQWGSIAIDAPRSLIYGQIPEGTGTGNAPAVPQFLILDAENLSVQQRLLLPENLAGKSILNAARDTMYSVSDSGIIILPVGDFKGVRRIQSNKQQLFFRGSFCERKVMTQEFTLTDTVGGGTDFRLSTALSGVRLTPSQGVTPAVIRVQVDPTVYQNRQGTATGAIAVASRDSVNALSDIRLTINTREPDQRGTVVDVPGKLVDILADPARNRFYIVRQDTHEVLAYDSTNFTQIASFKTGNTPTQMAITQDNRYLLVGHDNAQVATVIDLEAMRRSNPVIFPGGHYPRSIAVSGRAILASIRVAGDVHVIDRIDFAARRASELPSLGVFKNDVHINTTLVAPSNGSSIFGMMADGRVLLYEAAADSFTVARKDYSALAGAYAASNNGSFIVGNRLLNQSLVLQRTFDANSGASAGFAFIDDSAVRLSTTGASNPGILARVNTTTGAAQNATRTIEAPITEASTPGFAFIRTIAPLSNRQGIVALTQSGFTVIPWNYDALVPIPTLDRVLNAADNTAPVAPGGLISVYGYDLSPVNIATRDVPLPTALADSCLTVNGIVLPLVYVSSNQINAQLPFNVDGRAQMVLRSPAGVSNNLNLNIQRAAPSVFRSAAAPIVLRDGAMVSEDNPARPGDTLVIYATGLGVTSPSVEAGDPGPSEPLSEVVLRPEVSLDGAALPIDYAGLAPGQVGVYQLNVRISGSVKSGARSLRIKQGDAETMLPLPVVE